MLKPSQVIESVSDLKEMMSKTSIRYQKKRLKALYLFCSEKRLNRKQIAAKIGVDRKTVGHWFQTYASGGLEALLARNYSPGRPAQLTEEQQEILFAELNKSDGFSSYQQIVDYIEKTFDVKMKYTAVHSMVRYKWKAKPKVPRKSHIKKNETAGETFKLDLPETVKKTISEKDPASEKVRLFFEDESRFGLHPVSYRRITAPGVKPIAKISYTYENFYLYGAVEPITGESFFLEMPYLNSTCFQIFLDEFAKVYPASLNILVLDNGRFHQAKSLQVPDNIVLLFLPPYTPELNPIERLWQDIKAKLFQNVFTSLQEMQEKLTEILRSYTKITIESITKYEYITKIENVI